MIFVTVGTHEQQFDRLIEYVDDLKHREVIKEEVIIQSGYCTYVPKYCEYSKLLTYKEMMENINKARIIITHGGPSSFIMPLQIGKIPIIVPRQKKFDEHVNDHQVDFVDEVKKRNGNIITVFNINELEQTIENYDLLIEEIPTNIVSNNKKFNNSLEKIVNQLTFN